jgi:hypothetical protein
MTPGELFAGRAAEPRIAAAGREPRPAGPAAGERPRPLPRQAPQPPGAGLRARQGFATRRAHHERAARSRRTAVRCRAAAVKPGGRGTHSRNALRPFPADANPHCRRRERSQDARRGLSPTRPRVPQGARRAFPGESFVKLLPDSSQIGRGKSRLPGYRRGIRLCQREEPRLT